MSALISRILNSPHTGIAGAVYFLCKFGAIWLPQYKTQFEATEGVAVTYGLLMAGDSKPKNNEKEPPTYS